MDHAGRLAERAVALAKRIDLDARLARFQIDEVTRANLRQSGLGQSGALEGILIRFYEYLHRFPETAHILEKTREEQLRRNQMVHWSALLSGEIDQVYVTRSLLIGMAHFNAKVSTQSYIAAYSFFQTELLRAIMRTFNHAEFEALSISIGKVIMLDMSIALNAYVLDAMAVRA